MGYYHREPEEPKQPRGEWKDILAMILIAYQTVLPMLLLMLGVLVLAGLLFIWWFD